MIENLTTIKIIGILGAIISIASTIIRIFPAWKSYTYRKLEKIKSLSNDKTLPKELQYFFRQNILQGFTVNM